MTKVFKKRKGISFVEVMTTAAVLSFGLVSIYRAFFLSLDYLNHVTYRLHAANFLHNKIELIQHHYETTDAIRVGQGDHLSEVFFHGRRIRFNYEASVKPIRYLSGLHEISLTISWNEGLRQKQISRSAYIFNDSQKQNR